MSNVQRLRPEPAKTALLDQVADNLSKVGHRAKSLELARTERVVFDALSWDHRLAYAVFLRDGTWLIKFALEFPDTSVTQTIERKLIEYALSDCSVAAGKITAENKTKRAARAAAQKKAAEEALAKSLELLKKNKRVGADDKTA